MHAAPPDFSWNRSLEGRVFSVGARRHRSPEYRMPCAVLLPLAALGQLALGPINADGRFPNAGWVIDSAPTPPLLSPSTAGSGGSITIRGDSRVFLVQDARQTEWGEHHYMRLDLEASPLTFTLDLSNVPCGCLACVCA